MSLYDGYNERLTDEFIRRIVPKGKGFDDFSQEDTDLMMDHINSYRRKKLNGKSPYEAFCFYYGEELAQRLGYHEAAANSINLTPGFLKSNRKISTISGVNFGLHSGFHI